MDACTLEKLEERKKRLADLRMRQITSVRENLKAAAAEERELSREGELASVDTLGTTLSDGDNELERSNDDGEEGKMEECEDFDTTEETDEAELALKVVQQRYQARRQAYALAQRRVLTSLEHRESKARQSLHKAQVEESGGDYERERALTYTAEAAAAWDRKSEKRELRKARNTAFHDYADLARKTYKRQLRDLHATSGSSEQAKVAAPELVDAYHKAQVRAALEKNATLKKTRDGEIIAIIKDSTTYGDTDGKGEFLTHKADRAGIDRLVKDLRRADELREKKRRKRYYGREDDDMVGSGTGASVAGRSSADVTYINLKNKQFNEKLRRFYDKYTTDIRDSFERGTAI